MSSRPLRPGWCQGTRARQGWTVRPPLAVHEAGHAVVAFALGIPVHALTVDPDGNPICEFLPPGDGPGPGLYEPLPPPPWPDDPVHRQVVARQVAAMLAVLWGGPVAGGFVTGTRSKNGNNDSDRFKAKQLRRWVPSGFPLPFHPARTAWDILSSPAGWLGVSYLAKEYGRAGVLPGDRVAYLIGRAAGNCDGQEWAAGELFRLGVRPPRHFGHWPIR